MSETTYYLTDRQGSERRVTLKQFAAAETAAGFVNLSGGKSPTATAGFANPTAPVFVKGRIDNEGRAT